MGSVLNSKKKALFLFLSIAVLVVGALLPAPEGLSHGGKMTLVLLAFVFLMWVGDVMPKSVSSIAAIIMLPFFGAAESLGVVYGNFVNSIFFFLIAVFGIAAVVNHSDLPARMMVLFIRLFGNNSKRIILAFAATSWIVSAFMSDLAACALVAGIAISLASELQLPKKFVKCLMIAIPMGSMSGGVIMPISSATNATIMQLLAQADGTTVTFLQWMMVGVPAGLIGLLLAWLLLVLIFRPEPLDDACMQQLRDHFQSLGPLSTYDKKAIALIAGMLILWVAGSWIKVLDSTFVALIGFIVMFLPGMDLLTWDEYQRETPFDLILMLGAMFSLCAAMTACGTIDWIVNLAMSGASDWSPTMFFVIMSIMLVVVRAFIPNGAPVVVMVTPSLLAVGSALGADPMMLLIALSVWCQMTYLMPIIDSQWLMTYRSGAFTIVDLLKVGIPLSILFIVIYAIILPPLASFSYVVA